MEIRSHRAQIFTSISIIILALFLISVLGSTSLMKYYQLNNEVEQLEASVMFGMYDKLNGTTLPRMTSLATANALRASTAYIEKTGADISNFDTFFSILVASGDFETTAQEIVSTTDVSFTIKMVADPPVSFGPSAIPMLTQSFGSSVAVKQEFVPPETYRLDSITVEIDDMTATDATLVARVYKGEWALGEARLTYTAAGWYEFLFDDSVVMLEKDVPYYFVIAAPFTGASTDYQITLANYDSYICTPSCEASTLTLFTGSTDIYWPIDFYLKQEYMKTSSINDTIDAIEAFYFDNAQINLTLNLTGYEVIQEDPWVVKGVAEIELTTTKSTIAFEDVPLSIIGNVSIEGMRDPATILSGVDDREIMRSDVTTWNAETLNAHVRDGTFVYSQYAPTYLARFEGSTAASTCCGIEGLLDPTDPGDEPYIYTDYLFRSSEGECDPTGLDPEKQLYRINGLTDINSDFKLDTKRINFYQIDTMSGITTNIYACLP